jgi:hypothetical protein
MKSSKALMSYVEQCALVALEKQDKLDGLIADSLHELDLDAGTIRFNAYEFPMQVLGTESDNTLTWLWAWADEQTEIPASLMQSALQVKTWGADNGMPEFAAASVDRDVAAGEEIAMIATDLCSASCFFADHYEGGALFLLLFDKRIDDQPPFDRQQLARRMSDLFAQYDVNQKAALLSYLRKKGRSPVEEANVISADLESGERFIAEFDDAGRLLLVNGAAFE